MVDGIVFLRTVDAINVVEELTLRAGLPQEEAGGRSASDDLAAPLIMPVANPSAGNPESRRAWRRGFAAGVFASLLLAGVFFGIMSVFMPQITANDESQREVERLRGRNHRLEALITELRNKLTQAQQRGR